MRVENITNFISRGAAVGFASIREGLKQGIERVQIEDVIKRLNKNPEKLPKSVLIIPDKNRTFARENGMDIDKGHELGAKVLIETLRILRRLDIKDIFAWGLSSDNFGRSPLELNSLFSLIKDVVLQLLPELMENGTKFTHLGEKSRISDDLRAAFDLVEEKTRGNTKKRLWILADYGWDFEDARLLSRFAEASRNGAVGSTFSAEFARKLREEDLKRRDVPMIDLVVRTVGEGKDEGVFVRTSGVGHLANFARFYNVGKTLPEAGPLDFLKAIQEYAGLPQPRFGK